MRKKITRFSWKIILSMLLIMQTVLPIGALADEVIELSGDDIEGEFNQEEASIEDKSEVTLLELEATNEIATITSDWNGTVFGDVGGQDKITQANFGITENEDGTVTLRSSGDRGKISGSSDGIAYYFKQVPADANFTMTATATVETFVANNQVSFGIMLRDDIYEYVHGVEYGKGDYAAVGALDQKMKAFIRFGGAQTKIDFDNALDLPTSGKTYDLSVKKTGNLVVVKVGDEVKTIENFTGNINYAGLFTARNVEITYSNINLDIDGAVDLGDWEFRAFGGNTSADKNPEPTIHADGSMTLKASGGKIAGSDEGISLFAKEVPVDANFEITTTAKVNSFNQDSQVSTPNQKSFGLMLKAAIANHGDTSTHTSNYVAVGALDTQMKGFYKHDTQAKLEPFIGVNAPTAGEEYNLSIKKSGNTYVLTANGQAEVVSVEDLFNDTIHAGLFVARDADITFSDFEIKVDARTVTAISVDASAMKKEYLVNEALDLSGLKVIATYSDGTEATLSEADFIVTGFNSSGAGGNTITINYNGKTATIDLMITPLTVTELNIKYHPAKTTYYIGDVFDPTGLVVEAIYNNGQSQALTSEQYEFDVHGVFTIAGTITVTVTSTETSTVTTKFDIIVKAAAITDLEISQLPEKTQYFIGDELDLDGMVVYAKYDDGAKVRLMKDEYTVSDLDTTTAGDKKVTLTYKDHSTILMLNVKEKELSNIQITTYPQTTYNIGETFTDAGLVVSKVYDNGEIEDLSAGQFTLNPSKFDHTKAGMYDIEIIPDDAAIASIIFQVTVRNSLEPVWNMIRFGQSSSTANNTVTVNDDGTIKIIALEGGGKVTGDHDGISFYYTEIDAEEDNFELSATINVINYAKNPHDGQESFGIMARDAIGLAGDSSVFASNIAAIGGFSGGTTLPNGTQLFVRTGVESPDGAGSEGIQSIMLDNKKPTGSYKLTLAKTNSGYVGKINDGEEAIHFTPDILNVQDAKIYVGFYTARLATIEVSEIDFKVTAAKTDAPKVEAPKVAATPEFHFLSLDRTSLPSYELVVQSNVNGTVTVKQGQNIIATDLVVAAGKRVAIPATITAGKTNFSATFLPADTQLLTSYDKIVSNFTVEMNTYSGEIYVSPTGTTSGDGTKENPLDLDSAIAFVQPGQKIIVQDGTYTRNSLLDIKKYNDGAANARKYLEAAPGTRPIINFDKKSEGVVLSGNYWHVKGIDFKRSAGNTKGFTIGGSYNIVENSRFYENGDTGLQISRTDATAPKEEWPSYNLILNSTSFDNRDPSDNNADGFAAKLTSGEGNIFRGTIAHNNIDDGWDLYTKAGTGAIGAVIIEDSIAYNNGFLTDGTVGAGDKNGFKMGGEGIHVPHIIRNSMAFSNGAYGFTSNSNPGVIAKNNVGFNNERGNLSFTTYGQIQTDFTIDGFMSYQQESTAKDSYPAELASDKNFMFDGMTTMNKSGVKLTAEEINIFAQGLQIERDGNGNIIWGEFLRFIKPSTGTDPEVPGPKPETGTGSDSGTDSGSGTSSGGGSPQPPPQVPSINTPILDGEVARVEISDAKLNDAFSNAAEVNGVKQIQVELPKVNGAKSYELTLPTAFVSTAGEKLQIIVSTELGTIIIPGNMLSNAGLGNEKNITLSITSGDISTLSEDVRRQVGDRPIIILNIVAGGETVNYNNPVAPVEISIPYTPIAAELKNPEHITVWYIDGAGKPTPVTSAKYDAEAGGVTFTTTHFSQYAIVFVEKTFNDLQNYAWAKKEIEFLASKGIINGKSETMYAPSEQITRADFTLLLVRALDLNAEAGGDMFSDVTSADYFSAGVATARILGIVNGRGENQFNPRANISRQDMIVMAARALRVAGKLENGAAADLSEYMDKAQVSPYAEEDIALLVNAGLIKGNDQFKLKPLANTTRAEAAVLIYRMYNR